MSKDVHTDDDFRAEVGRWLRANGVNPGDLPIDSVISIADRMITFRRFIRDADGRKRINGLENCLLTEVATVPLLVEPTGDVAEWLRPKCPACGR